MLRRCSTTRLEHLFVRKRSRTERDLLVKSNSFETKIDKLERENFAKNFAAQRFVRRRIFYSFRVKNTFTFAKKGKHLLN
jgi:hypothetical protein